MLYSAPLLPEETPLVIMAEGFLTSPNGKVATGVLRYGRWPVVAVIDSSHAGQTTDIVLGFGKPVPIVAHLTEALKFQPAALLLGTAPQGGGLPTAWKNLIEQAIQARLHVISGLHDFIADNPIWQSLAKQNQVTLWDVRNTATPEMKALNRVAQLTPRPSHTRVVTMVGSDCAVGKMSVALETAQAFRTSQFSAQHAALMVPTGQTGILIEGWGVPLDRMIGDFMAGAIETCISQGIDRLTLSDPGKSHWLLVEGQGSLLHPGYSGVTMSLLHGSHPDAMILCHKESGDKHIRGGYPVEIPTMQMLIQLYETAAQWARDPNKPSARVVGIAVNTSALSESEATAILSQYKAETGLPVTDPVRYGAESLVKALIQERNELSL
ncbi:MAG: DUF1611 domain-containing protein [Cyanobacteria bacterium]|nr:DUF1611 domain-containing protein [Cyanobacteriota bacterium]